MTLVVVDDGYFWRFRWLRLRKLQRYGKQYYNDDMLPVVDWQMIANERP